MAYDYGDHGLESGYGRKALRIAERKGRASVLRLRSKMQSTFTTRTVQGAFTFSTKDTGVGANLYIWRQHEYDFSLRALDFLIQNGFVPKNDLVMFDVGANIGVIAIGLIRAGRVEKAVCFEPEPQAFELLKSNVDLNGLVDRIVCLNVAVGDRAGLLTMETSKDNLGDHRVRSSTPLKTRELHDESERTEFTVQSIPLDDASGLVGIGFPGPSMMWIDVQGYEGFVFSGGSSLLAAGLPTVTEIWPYAIMRAGMTPAEFCDIVSRYWDTYWVDRRGRFTSYPISVLTHFFDEIGPGEHQENVIFTSTQTAPARQPE